MKQSFVIIRGNYNIIYVTYVQLFSGDSGGGGGGPCRIASKKNIERTFIKYIYI